MQTTPIPLRQVIDSFFDANTLGFLRNTAMLNCMPILYGLERGMESTLLWNYGGIKDVEADAELHARIQDFIDDYLVSQALESAEKEDQSQAILEALTKEIRLFELQMSDLFYAGTVKSILLDRQITRIWTIDLKDYALLSQSFKGVGLHFILNLTWQTLVFVHEPVMFDYALFKLMHMNAPIYTDLPWPQRRKEDLYRRMGYTRIPTYL